MPKIFLPKLNRRSSSGFTLIELLIYLTIVSVVLNTLIIFALNVMNLGAKNRRAEDVASTAVLIAEKIKYEIKNADDINTGSSNFGVNLATNPGTKISLKQSGANDPTVFDVSAEMARITRGNSSPVSLNPPGTEISDLTFTNLSSADGLTKQLKFTLIVMSSAPSSGNVFEKTSLESSVELRSHP